ncbi:MAG: sigma-54 dependent transcriptional regulator [Proteobacteria bacterium]|nr:sigma-54 dependent transcriptional regulator [Pseudomonadota bacterium]
MLLVDDDNLLRLTVRPRLESLGYSIVEARTGDEARAAFRERLDAVLLDYRLPDADGISLLRELKATQPDTPVVLLTGHSTVEMAVDAMKRGAFDYVTKPCDADKIAMIVERALDATRLAREVRGIVAGGGQAPVFEDMVGESEALRGVKILLDKIAHSPASTVLLTGESGTGKDVAARCLHSRSARSAHPFMNITCSALPETLLESELFGHERGAFTDAKQQKKGLLEQADRGSVFLDEIGEMSLALQAKLLRFLEDKAFRRLGGIDEVRPDVRVVAATNRDLREAVRLGTFREDLYYRLTVLHVHLPPLRERDHDIELLAKCFVDRFNREFHKRVNGIRRDAMTLLEGYGWPGNVRELKNAIERAVLLTDQQALGPQDFSACFPNPSDTMASQRFRLPPGGVNLHQLEQDLVVQALARTKGNQTRAAALLGLNRDQIRYRIEKFGLRPELPERDR